MSEVSTYIYLITTASIVFTRKFGEFAYFAKNSVNMVETSMGHLQNG
jgi:hypothetical protein